jgi:hypothetical protein
MQFLCLNKQQMGLFLQNQQPKSTVKFLVNKTTGYGLFIKVTTKTEHRILYAFYTKKQNVAP